MLDWRLRSVRVTLAVMLLLWISGNVLSLDVPTEGTETNVLDSEFTNTQSLPTDREVKSATDLAAKLLFLDEFVSLENDVIETKKKRSFSGFGSPLDRLSAGSADHKGKQRKVVGHPKRRFGIPMDRIGRNRISNSRG
ncbi:osteocrin isoform X1 [Ochotona princeps]|uniref:osteocrin isoform X1 n=1 Tax=Ochotona princeps TaxID=9978 RepID=UPI00032AED99|nr:osteocrin isoform X1 [Ochotona princeps]